MIITHPRFRHLNYTLSDTSTLGLFRWGWDRALACWRSGCSTESLTHMATTASPQHRGVVAACEMIMGWRDIAEREARAHGMSRDEAARFVNEQAEVLRRST